MAVPKKRMSGQKRRQRRSHDGLKAPAPSTCPRCSQPKRPHCVCGNCGFYKGEMLVDMKKL